MLKAGSAVDGLAIVEHPMMTLVIPPENHIEFDEHKSTSY